MNLTIEYSTAAAETTDSGIWYSSEVTAAAITLLGVLCGLIIRDVGVAFYQARQKRKQDLWDKANSENKQHSDLVRLYSDPLKESVTSLRHRLNEIVEQKQARYLLANTPVTPFLEYKRISTLYRIAAVLGWIRAIRRERSYLDPREASSSVEMNVINEFEKALADGTHVELQRLTELSNLWRIPTIAEHQRKHIANLIDNERADFLAQKNLINVSDMIEQDQTILTTRCAEIIRREANIDIPTALVAGTVQQSMVTLGIKEAYVYRDWQVAIGDMMLEEDRCGARHFTVLGFGLFEDLIFKAHDNPTSYEARWIGRLERIIHDLDMTKTGFFDARRDQLRRLYNCVVELEAQLEQRIPNSEEL